MGHQINKIVMLRNHQWTLQQVRRGQDNKLLWKIQELNNRRE
jgi:hypothetical protein